MGGDYFVSRNFPDILCTPTPSSPPEQFPPRESRRPQPASHRRPIPRRRQGMCGGHHPGVTVGPLPLPSPVQMQLSPSSPSPELGRTSDLRHLLLVMVRGNRCPAAGDVSRGIEFLVRRHRRGQQVLPPSGVCGRPPFLLPFHCSASSGVSRRRRAGPHPLDL
jgi:hypothetical protein